MRLDTPVRFERLIPGKLDQTTGNRLPPQTVSELHMASVTSGGTESLRMVTGSEGGMHRSTATIPEGTLTIRIIGCVRIQVDQIRVGTKAYKILQRRRLRRLETFVVKEVQQRGD